MKLALEPKKQIDSARFLHFPSLEILMVEVLRLECNACKTPAAMVVTKIAKFSGVVRVIGVVLLVPSFLVIGLAGLMFLSTIVATGDVTSNAHTEAQQTGAAIGFAIGLGLSFLIGEISLVGGSLGMASSSEP